MIEVKRTTENRTSIWATKDVVEELRKYYEFSRTQGETWSFRECVDTAMNMMAVKIEETYGKPTKVKPKLFSK